MFGSGIFLARHTRSYESWNQVGQLCLGLQAQLMFAIFPHLFLRNAICGLKDTLNFIILLSQDSWLGLWAWRQPGSCPRCGKVTSQKLKPMVALRVESCSILKLLKRQLFYFEASGKACLWRGTRKSALDLSLNGPLSIINWLSFLSRKQTRY